MAETRKQKKEDKKKNFYKRVVDAISNTSSKDLFLNARAAQPTITSSSKYEKTIPFLRTESPLAKYKCSYKSKKKK